MNERDWMVPRVGVIPAHNRPVELDRLLHALHAQCDIAVIIDNASDPPLDPKPSGKPLMYVIRDEEQPPNLYRLWNVGIDAARASVRRLSGLRGSDPDEPDEPWDLAIFNDDADVPSGWWDVVSAGLRGHPTAAVACTGAYEPVRAPVLKTAPDGDLWGRMTPWAFVARGELGQRGDERFRWWWGDSSWDFEARSRGGVLTVPGPVVRNTGANTSTVGALAEQAGRDRQTFIEIYGKAPW